MLYLISLSNILLFLVYVSGIKSDQCIPQYFALFDSIINGMVSLMSSSESLLLECGNAPDLV